MTDVTIRGLDDETVEILDRRAKRYGRSLEDEAREILTRVALPMTPARLRVEAARIAAMTPDVPQTDSTEPIRRDRGNNN